MMIRPGIELANLTDIGCARTENEDYYGYAEPEDDGEFLRRGRLAVVADGMGGYEGGQIASGLAVDVVRDTYLHDSSGDPQDSLAAALANAHAAIQDYAAEHPELRGMGTTCTAVALLDGHLSYGHVGDSRLYRIRSGAITRLTQDQTYVNRLLEQGLITPEEAATHPERNVLTSALGMEGAVPAEFPEAPIAVAPGDTFLICTDGLHGLVSDDEMLSAVTGNTPQEACRQLVEMAKSRGGHDNITLQILRVEGH
ncbi:MAG TPA: PP2C family serine/threonine-protein phosphatase [Terriglobia bacterium]|nr:PP2C family serine/threonine-protein phosphatase [Terriglobia bacterium]